MTSLSAMKGGVMRGERWILKEVSIEVREGADLAGLDVRDSAGGGREIQ